jgi:hypothetical protein
MCRRENQQKTKKADQVGVIYVSSLIEKEKISVGQEKERDTDAIEKANGHEQRENAEQNPVNVEAVAGPGMDPGEAWIFKQEGWFDPPLRNSIKRPNQLHHPEHETAECDSEKNQRCDIDWRKALIP